MVSGASSRLRAAEGAESVMAGLDPAIHKIASLLKFLIFAMSLVKSRRLERDKVGSGTDNSKANWVRKMKYDELRRLAASAEKGSCVAISTAVTSEYRLPRR
jgi:hypothetical protein